MLEEHRRDLLPGHLIDARVDVLDAREVGQELRRGLRPDPGYPGQVVRGVTAERRELHVALRRDAEALQDRVRGHRRRLADALQRVEDGDVTVDQLHRVAVPGHDLDPVAVGDRTGGERREHVVRLDALDLDDRDAEHREHLVEPVDLRAELVGHLVASGLVVLVGGGPLVVLAHVERDGDRGRRPLPDQPHEHGHEPVDRVRELAGRGPEGVGEGEEGPVGEAVSVQQEQQGPRVPVGAGAPTRSRSRHGTTSCPATLRQVDMTRPDG